MGALTGNTISSSYLGLLKTSDNAILNTSLRLIEDGGGTDASIKLSTTQLGLSDGTTTVPSLTFSSDPDTGLYYTTNKINATIGGNTYFELGTSSLKLSAYGSGSITGTVTQRLGVTSSGQVVEIPIGAGAVDGSGTAGRLAKWSDSDTITNSGISDSSNALAITINGNEEVGIGVSPLSVLHIGKPSGNTNLRIESGTASSVTGTSTITMISRNASSGTSPSIKIESIFEDSNDSALAFHTTDAGTTAEKMRLDSSGRFGIGLTPTTSPLEIKSNSVSSQGSGLSIIANGSSDAIIKMGERATNGARFHLFDGGVEKIAFYTDGTDNHISAGNVGIGTSSPVTTLTLGTGTTGMSFISSDTSFNSGKIAVIKQSEVGSGNGHLLFETYEGGSGGGERMRLDSSGDLTMKGGRIIVRESDDGNDAVKITRDADEGYVQLFSSGSQTVELRGNGASYFNGGNVGIGESSPTVRLQVSKGAIHEQLRVHRDVNGDNTTMGSILLAGDDSDGNITDYARIHALSESDNAGSEDGALVFSTLLNSSLNQRMKIDSTGKIIFNDDVNIQGTTFSAGFLRFNSSGKVRLSANNNLSLGYAETLNITNTGKVLVNVTSNQTDSKLTVRQNGSSFEFGHINQTSGYYGTLGAMSSSGAPFIAFSADNSSANTFTTRGKKGFVIHQDTGLNGDLYFSAVTDANTADQSLTTRMQLNADGELRLRTYGSGTHTGTATKFLAVDSSGNVIEEATSTIDGSGTAGKIVKWSDADSITDSIMTESTNTIQILSDGTGTNGAILELKHANNNSNDICATINMTNNTGGYAAIEGGTTGANNTGYIAFKTDDAGSQSEAMRITGNNYIGMGESDPDRPLHVKNSSDTPILVQSTDDTTGILFKDDTSSNALYYRGNGDYFYTTSELSIGSSSSPSNTLVLSRSSSGQAEHGLRLEFTDTDGPTSTNSSVLVGSYGLKFKNHNSSRNFIFDSGNVGIGTSSPNSLLTLESASSPTLRLKDTTNNCEHFYMHKIVMLT